MSTPDTPTPSRRLFTIHQQFLLALIGVNMLVMAGTSAIFYQQQKQTLLAEIDERLTVVAQMAKELLPSDYHDRIDGQESVSGDEFQQIVGRYNRLCVKLGLEYIWSLLLVDGRIVFTTSTSPDKKAENRLHAGFFEPHSSPELYTNTFATMRAAYKSNHDKWGDIRVALIPSVDVRGRKYLFGASVRLTDVNQQLRDLVWQALAVGLAVFAFSMAVGLWVARLVTGPIHRLTEAIREIAAGGKKVDADEYGTYEQVMLARHFNRLNHALQEKIAQLEGARERLLGQRDVERRQAEEDLVLSEQRYRRILNFAVDGILIGTCDGIIVETNECMCQIFGMARHEVIGKHIREMPFTAESMQKRPWRFDLLQRGETVVSERTVRRRDNSEVIIEMHTKMMPDGTYQSIYHEITARKRAEEALMETRRLLDEAQKLARMGAWKYEVATGRIVWTDEVYRIHGVDRSFDTNDLERALSFYAPESVPVLRRAMGRAVELGEPFDLELEFIRANGERIWVRSCGRANVENGRTVSVSGSFMDINERKRIERELKNSEERYRMLFEMESDAIFLIDNDSGSIIDCNLAAQALYGFSREELLALRNVDLSAEPELTRRATEKAADETPSLLRIALRRHRRRDGTAFPVEIAVRCFSIHGRSVHIAAIRDITERLKSQELLESWNATLIQRVAERTTEVEKYTHQLQALTGRLAHAEEEERKRISNILHEDVQQTLAAARMTLGVAREMVRGAAARETLDRADSMLEQSIRLTRSLVHDISVPAVRERDLPFAIGWLSQQMQEKFGLTVTLVAEAGVPPLDENMYLCLYRAAQELLFNVVKHARVRQASVFIRRDGDNGVQLVVCDCGCGFAQDPAKAMGVNGDGFGLFSTRERVEGLGGRMTVETVLGKGTTVTLRAPVKV